jgi:hypothetical protein
VVEAVFLTYEDAARLAGRDEHLATLFHWIDSYPMAHHPDLGRPGPVCPFTRPARALNLLRLSVCDAGPTDEDAIFERIRHGLRCHSRIPASGEAVRLRAVVIGFPGCASDEGTATLRRVCRRHKYYTLIRLQMLGFFHQNSTDPGLWNSTFHPMRAPYPILAIRHLVEQDAGFAAKNHLLMLPYLLRFPVSGARRLYAHLRRAVPDPRGTNRDAATGSRKS